MGMKEMLEYLKGQSDEQLSKQIQYILNQLTTVGKSQDEEEQEELENEDEDYDDDYGDEDNYEEEEDNFEDEPDIMDEDVEKLHDEMKKQSKPVGEEWLTTQFLLPNEEAFS